MNTASRALAFTAALLALSAVILAAMGSHLFDMNGLQGTFQIASNIHLFNSAALLGLAALLARLESRVLGWGAWLIVAGTLVFCGSIYLHVVTGYVVPRLTPSGGLLMMAGWALAALAFIRRT